MDIAIVTGAERGIGLQIARKLIDLGFRVYGLAQDFSKCPFEHPDFLAVNCDLTARSELESAFAQIQERDPCVNVLVNAARFTPSASFEEAPLEEIEYALQTELLCPLYLTRLALPLLVKFHGYVINIAWNGQGALAATNAAAQGGLHFFAQQLFEEVRDSGVKVSTLYPQFNTGEPDPKARVQMEPQSSIEAALFAQAVEAVLRFKENNCISQLVVRPQGTREEPKIPVAVSPLSKAAHKVQLPERKNFPIEPEPIPTPPRERPADAPPPGEDDDWDEDEWDEDDELDELLEESRRLLKKQKEEAKRKLDRTRGRNEQREKNREQSRQRDDKQDNQEPQGKQEGQEGSDDSREGGKKRRRRRRRGGRNRNRDRQDGQQPTGENQQPRRESQPDGEPRRDGDDSRDERKQPRREGGDRPRREGQPAPDAPVKSAAPVEVQQAKSAVEKPAAEKPVPKEGPSDDKPKKKAAKKAAKKATKKAAKKATKKAAKKATRKAAKKAVKKAAAPAPETPSKE